MPTLYDIRHQLLGLNGCPLAHWPKGPGTRTRCEACSGKHLIFRRCGPHQTRPRCCAGCAATGRWRAGTPSGEGTGMRKGGPGLTTSAGCCAGSPAVPATVPVHVLCDQGLCSRELWAQIVALGPLGGHPCLRYPPRVTFQPEGQDRRVPVRSLIAGPGDVGGHRAGLPRRACGPPWWAGLRQTHPTGADGAHTCMGRNRASGPENRGQVAQNPSSAWAATG